LKTAFPELVAIVGEFERQIAADGGAVYDARSLLSNLRRAYGTSGRIAGEINDRILAGAILEDG
jgi:hypothetical protein